MEVGEDYFIDNLDITEISGNLRNNTKGGKMNNLKKKSQQKKQFFTLWICDVCMCTIFHKENLTIMVKAVQGGNM